MLIVVGALVFVVGVVLPSPPFQALGGLLVGAGLSALVGALTGRWAIRQQSAKEANVSRKEHIYGPLYTELKAVRTAFDKAEEGNAPAPQWIDNGVEVQRAGITMYQRTSALTLKLWPEFQRGYHDTDFTVATREQLNNLHESATTYNNAVEAARQAAIPILAAHIDYAITEFRHSQDYKQWQEQDAQLKANPPPLGTGPPLEYGWYGYIEYVVERSAAAGESRGGDSWPDTQTTQPSM